MRYLEPLKIDHFDALYSVSREAETFGTAPMLDSFRQLLMQWEGWTVFEDEEIIGAVGLSSFVPGCDALLHCFIKPNRQSKWCTRAMLREVFSHIFISLDLPRVSGISIRGKTDKAGSFLERIGFRREGTKRKGTRIDGELFDVEWYGLLKEECRWTK